MALIFCPDCGKRVSEYAHTCPNCGYQIKSIIQPFINGEINDGTDKSNLPDISKESWNRNNSQMHNQRTVSTKESAQEATPSDTNKYSIFDNKVRIGLFAGGILLLLIIVIALFFHFTNNTVAETDFYTKTVKEGEKAYLDITSIIPERGIFKEGDAEYNWFICKGSLTYGFNAYVLISCDDYRKYFDSGAITIKQGEFNRIKYLTPSKRIHGIARMSDSVVAGLSRTVGAYVLEFVTVD